MVDRILLPALALVVTARIRLRNVLRSESGQDLIEYAVLAGAIAFAGAVALIAIGPGIFTDFAQRIEDCVTLADECDIG